MGLALEGLVVQLLIVASRRSYNLNSCANTCVAWFCMQASADACRAAPHIRPPCSVADVSVRRRGLCPAMPL